MTAGPALSIPNGHRNNRWSELDGLRFFAVAGVLAQHFTAGPHRVPWGTWGVDVFFVLSGFLITHGLLGARARTEALQTTSPQELRMFFIRRILRLWPLYFAVITVTCAFNVELARQLFPWNATFTTNHAIDQLGAWPGVHSHLWTLAVEQQFYICWPLVILLLPLRISLTTLAVSIVIAPALRATELVRLASTSTDPEAPAGLLLPMCVDSLSWGALLACTFQFRPELLRRHANAAGPVALALFGALFVFYQFGPDRLVAPVAHTVARSGLAFAAVLLVTHCVSEVDSPISKLLRVRALTYLGMISYGIYLMHNFTHWLGQALLRRVAGQSTFAAPPLQLLYLLALSVGLAVVSWHFFESPLQRLGRRLVRPT